MTWMIIQRIGFVGSESGRDATSPQTGTRLRLYNILQKRRSYDDDNHHSTERKDESQRNTEKDHPEQNLHDVGGKTFVQNGAEVGTNKSCHTDWQGDLEIDESLCELECGAHQGIETETDEKNPKAVDVSAPAGKEEKVAKPEKSETAEHAPPEETRKDRSQLGLFDLKKKSE